MRGADDEVISSAAARRQHRRSLLCEQLLPFHSRRAGIQVAELVTITVGHSKLEAVGARVPLAAVDAVGAVGAVETMIAVRPVHWMQSCTMDSVDAAVTLGAEVVVEWV